MRIKNNPRGLVLKPQILIHYEINTCRFQLPFHQHDPVVEFRKPLEREMKRWEKGEGGKLLTVIQRLCSL